MAAKKRENIKCAHCWKEFYPRRKESKYCSIECSKYARITRQTRICPQCGIEFYYYPWASSEKKYCWKACYDKAQTKLVDRDCVVCWKHFHPKRESTKFCSKECYNKQRCHDKWICPICNSEFIVNSTRTKYCSKECMYKAMTKDNSICPICWKEFHADRKQAYCSEKCFWVAHREFMKKKWIESSEEEKQDWISKWTWNNWSVISKINVAYQNYLNSLWFKSSLEFKLWWKSFDIKVWDVLLEINPSYTHNSTIWPTLHWIKWEPKDSKYHYNKLKVARDNWYRCIMIWDWDDCTKIPYLLNWSKQTIYARECDIKQINREDCHDLFESYHLQWDTLKNKNNIYIWLYYNNELVECMSFWKPRYNKNYEWEILRLCSHKNFKVVWWADRIFKKFLSITNANSVISYCDMSKFDWKVYEKLWFKLAKRNRPSKHWYNWKEIESRRHITDNFLRQRWFDQIFWENYWKWTDNDILMIERGYVEIYDCGQSTFVWVRELATQG